MSKRNSCWGDVMGDFKRKQLHSGKKGPIVKNRQQAKAIAASICNNGEADFSCSGGCGGNCGCPGCKDMARKKASMMAMGYSEEAVEAVLFSQEFSENDTARMVVSRLQVIQARAMEAVRVIEAGMASGAEVEFEQWAIDKITLAADYISAAVDNIHHGDAMELEMDDDMMPYKEKKGLWANIHAKRERIKRGSGERMRKPGEKGAPSAKALRDSSKEEK